MCIIMFHKPGVDIPENALDNSAVNHPHGGGIAYINTNKTLKVWKTLNCDEVKPKYLELKEKYPKSPLIVHYRKSTAGSISLENVHPFMVDKDTVFAHNKTIYKCNPGKDDKSGKSDTRIFNERVLQKLPSGWMHSEGVAELLKDYIANSRIIVMNSAGEYTIYGEEKKNPNNHSAVLDAGWRGGVWYSNNSFLRLSPPVETKKKDTNQTHKYHNNARSSRSYGGFMTWKEDGIAVRYNHHSDQIQAYDTEAIMWRNYDLNKGCFTYASPTIAAHRPAHWKEGAVKQITATVATKDDTPKRKCVCCLQSHPASQVTLVRLDNIRNQMLCPSCVQFYRGTDVEMQFIGMSVC